MAEEHIYRLSTIDKSLVRVYIRYCLCFACDNADIDTIANKLALSTQRTVTQSPILAGTVRPVAGSSQEGRLEVAVTLQQMNGFQPRIRHLRSKAHIRPYEELSASGMPPLELICDDITPMPDKPDPPGSPVFAIQASFIRGGVIIALYLHHSVADIHGLGHIMRSMSGDLPVRKLDSDDLRSDSVEQSRLRDRLSGSRVVKAHEVPQPENEESSTDEVCEPSRVETDRGSCRVFALDLELINGTKDMMNERFHYYQGFRAFRAGHMSGFDCTAAILWKAIMRACWPQSIPDDDQRSLYSNLVIPVNVRERIDPPLDEDFFGNAGIHANAYSALTRPVSYTHLTLPTKRIV